VKIAVTGAAGQIGYSLVFRIASGSMLGPDQPVILQLLELPVPQAQDALKGVLMELQDCAFPLLSNVTAHDNAETAFAGIDYAMLVGAKPRGPGMERKDLLSQNGAIFKVQGTALNNVAKKDVRVLVVGNPANTNALIAQKFAPTCNPGNFTAMTRLDHNRAVSQLAAKCNVGVTAVEKVCIWGNHSSTQYPDINNATVNGTAASKLVQEDWTKTQFIPVVQQRGAAIIAARKSSSAASAANAASDHMRSWTNGTNGGWVSMAIPSTGLYDIPKGVIYSYPVTCADGKYKVVEGLPISAFSREKMDASYKELAEERDALKELLSS